MTQIRPELVIRRWRITRIPIAVGGLSLVGAVPAIVEGTCGGL